MANPFLIGDLDGGDTQVSSIGNNFNPFLSGDFSSTSTADNPFMSAFSAAEDHKLDSDVSSTNPFAFSNDTTSTTAPVDLFGSFTSNAEKEKDKVQETVNYDDIFSMETKSFTNDNLNDFFGISSSAPVNQVAIDVQETKSPDNLTLLEDAASTNFFSIDHTDVIKHETESGTSTCKAGPPKRPPPPRPFAPPSKETKDLILSVTGAMEATSSDLLDRLRATRTPSPTPIKDLNSPSPTPDVSFNELLETEEPMHKEDHNIVPIQDLDLLGDMDSDTIMSSAPVLDSHIQPAVSAAPTLPVDNVRVIETVIQPSVEPLPVAASIPPRPAPPTVPERPKLPPQIMTHNIIDAFATEEHAQHESEINQEIVNIFDGPTSTVSEPEVIASVEQALGFTSPEISAVTTIHAPPPSLPFEPHAPVDDKQNVLQDLAETMQPDFNMLDTAIAAATVPTSAVNEASLFFDSMEQSKPSLPFAEQPAAAESLISSQSFNIFDQPPTEHVKTSDDFDAFTAKFENAILDEISSHVTGVPADPFDPFSSSAFAPSGGGQDGGDVSMGFGADDNFDSFLALQEPPPVPQSTPARFSRAESAESDDADNDFNIFIKPKQQTESGAAFEGADILPALAPPPKSPIQNSTFQDSSPRFNPFDKSQDINQATENIFAEATEQRDKQVERSDSQETPPTPLFDEDVSQPLEDFPRINFTGSGWEMQLRQPNKKKITGQRFWKKVFIKLVYQGENPVLQLFNNKDDKDPFQELPLQPCYSVSDIGAQQYDNYGKIFTVKLQFIFYKERPGVRPGQVTKAERITNKLSQFAAYAIQGDYQGVKEFGSDLKKLGLPVEHAPQISQLFKIGSQNYEDMKQFSVCVEEALFRLSAHRDRALNYKMEEVQITAVDELYVDQNMNGGVIKQIARVRLFFLGFLSGMPDVELGVNDMVRQGKEVVGRHDIIPVVTEEWIRLEGVEFHSCVQQDEYERTRTIKFKPPDACYIELMRFRVRPPRNRELPLQLKTKMCITGNKVELRADILVPGFASRKLGQIPCEDVVVRFPIPECWIYLFRVEKHFRYGSVKSSHRRTGKIKGIERFLGAVDNLEPSLMEVTSGQAKYEHQHRAIVWRMPRLPKEGQGAYTTHNLVCRMALTSYDQIPDELAQYCYVEFTMPATQVSHTTVRSVSIANSDSDTPPEKYVRQLARHEYRVEIEHTQADGPGEYIAATTMAKPVAPVIEEQAPAAAAAPDSDSDSSS